MAFNSIGALLKEAMGLDIDSIGASALQRALRERLSACRIVDLNVYLQHLHDSETELQELIEAIVVHETWFFRDREAFAALVRNVYDPSFCRKADSTLRLLSLPCSTGEEPYTIAMALLDAGIAADRFQIDAFDISAPSLARARRGVYGSNSFRGEELDFRKRHFEPTGRHYRLHDSVRRQVRFQQANFLARDFVPSAEPYDAIFCRNMIIYFDGPTQDRAVAVLRGLLAPTALLFVGPSETALFLNHGFHPLRIPHAFAFRMGTATARKTGGTYAVPAPLTSATRSLRAPRIPPSDPTPAVPTEAPRPSGQRAANVVLDATDRSDVPAESGRDTTFASDLELATRLADRGDFVEAERICAAHLRRHGPSAAIFYLTGLIRDAGGALTEAAECYRKALYLDHDHLQALFHLALLLEKRGDAASARVLRNRADRLDKSGVG
jgi:chemotaxis protein methyltransferase WspC